VTGNTIKASGEAAKTTRAMTITNGTTNVIVADNILRSLSTTVDTGILIQTGGTDERVKVIGNEFHDFYIAVNPIDCYSTTITQNDFYGSVLVPVSVGGTKRAGLRIFGNTPVGENTVLTDNSATPSVAGLQDDLCSVGNSSSTTITNFTNGYAGQIIRLYATNGNTTLQQGSTIKLHGGVDFAMATDDSITLQLRGSAWREVGRSRAAALTVSAGGTGQTTAQAAGLALVDAIPGLRVLWKLEGANMNSTADQQFTRVGTWTRAFIQFVWVLNPSTSMTTAQGGIYTAASKGGAAVVAASAAYTPLTASNSVHASTVAARPSDATTLYLSLTTPQGSAATADFYIVGIPIS